MTRLPGIPNFRDAGGLPSGSMAPGVVYRSAQLSGLGTDDRSALADLGVAAVFDLRTAEEATHRPDSLPPALRPMLLDVLADRPHSGAAAVASLVNAHAEKAPVDDVNAAVSDGRARDLMIETYRHLVSLPSAHRGYGLLLSALADKPGASVVHCTAGKDRTGWAVAVLQRLCGASMDDVVADYLLSNGPMVDAYGPMLEAFAAEGGDSESLADMIYVRPEYLESAIDLVHRVHGGLEQYVTSTLGVGDARVRALRRRLAG